MRTVLFLCRANHYRSRIAEIFFNWHAAQQDLPWRAASRGLNIDPRNPGHISRHALSRLLLLEIPSGDYRRFPMDLTPADLRSADHIVAVQGTEHRPLITARFPEWLDRIEYWEIPDIDFTSPEEALPKLETEVTALLERLKSDSPEFVKLSKGWSRSATMSNRTFTPGPTPNTVKTPDGKVLTAPKDWLLLPPGDAALTRRVKAAGDHWMVAEKKGRKVFSRGVWAPAATIEQIRAELETERSTETYAKRKVADAKRRERVQAEYVEDFHGAVVAFLAFHPTYADLADQLAQAVTAHATPVGSGTVARTKRIPVKRRAEAAVIAWMRHQTTGYDNMVIPRVRGKRQEVRRILGSAVQRIAGPISPRGEDWRGLSADEGRLGNRRFVTAKDQNVKRESPDDHRLRSHRRAVQTI